MRALLTPIVDVLLAGAASARQAVLAISAQALRAVDTDRAW